MHEPNDGMDPFDAFDDFINGMELPELPEPMPDLIPIIHKPITWNRIEADLRAYVRRTILKVADKDNDDRERYLTVVHQLIREELLKLMVPKHEVLAEMDKVDILANSAHLFMTMGWVVYIEVMNGYGDRINEPYIDEE
jgi:hypothetical protein